MAVSRNPLDPPKPSERTDEPPRPRIQIDPQSADLIGISSPEPMRAVRIQVAPPTDLEVGESLRNHVPVVPVVAPETRPSDAAPTDAGLRAARSELASQAKADPTGFAQQLLRMLGRSDHPEAADNPIYALYQVAVDHRCSATGYRTLCDALRTELEASRGEDRIPPPPTARV